MPAALIAAEGRMGSPRVARVIGAASNLDVAGVQLVSFVIA
jgi:hypothetical protein